MLIVTNRNINQDRFQNGVADEFAFGEQVNAKGPNEIRLAHAKKIKTGDNAGQWRIKLVKEPKNLTADNLPSKHEFAALRKRLHQANKNCVFFIHGYNQSFQKNLAQSLLIEQLYDVEVVAFSWPSNTGGFTIREYRDAKRTAQASVAALDATLMKLGAYHCGPFDREARESCDVKLSLMAY
ncbi:MAG: alpha/beta hydrolase, partial [Proteobacteria bacterium]